MNAHEIARFTLPMTTVVSVRAIQDGYAAHSLDFDLVSVATTPEEAMDKVHIAVKHYVEFGIKNRLETEILQKAPEEFWRALTPDVPVSIGTPIEIEGHSMIVVEQKATTDERRYAASAA